MALTKLTTDLIDSTIVTSVNGSTGAVTLETGTDWQATPKTANFTAVAGEGYFVNTTSAAITVTLPSSPTAGDEVSIVDYAGTAATNNITITSSDNINGSSNDVLIDYERGGVSIVYVDATQGWIAYNAANETATALVPGAIVASGGTEVTSGGYKYHTFLSSGTFTVTSAGDVEYLVIAGGGGGGHGGNSSNTGGGGGAGGLIHTSSATLSSGSYTVTVGGGGAVNTNGTNSSFNSTTANGGGAGGDTGGSDNGNNGGSGGGAGPDGSAGTAQSGQGFAGGASNSRTGGGGGGAGAVGGTGTDLGLGHPGGDGVNTYSVWATATSTGDAGYYAGGGGSGTPAGTTLGGPGGAGGGGTGGYQGGTTAQRNGQPGTDNTGGGGGSAADGTDYVSAAGGSGIVIIRYTV